MKCQCIFSAGNGNVMSKYSLWWCTWGKIFRPFLPNHFFFLLLQMHTDFCMFKYTCEIIFFFLYSLIICGICTWEMYMYASCKYGSRYWMCKYPNIACRPVSNADKVILPICPSTAEPSFFTKDESQKMPLFLLTSNVIAPFLSSFGVLLSDLTTCLCQESITEISKVCESANTFCTDFVLCLS